MTVRKGDHPPSAVRHGGRRFLIRVDDRLNEMTREQIRDGFAKETKEVARDLSALKAALRERLKVDALKKDQLWLGLVPTERLFIDLSDEGTRNLFWTWLTEPKATANRRSGNNFACESGPWAPHLPDGHLSTGQSTTSSRRTSASAAKQLSLSSCVRFFPIPGARNQFDSYSLLEYPTSVFRLMGKLLGRFSAKHMDSMHA